MAKNFAQDERDGRYRQKEVMSNEERENLREAYLERSAILEFDAGMTRQEANRLAWQIVYGKGEKKLD